ncbi:hypothetical protein ACSAZL_03865 [Methanosarcina sp. T3]
MSSSPGSLRIGFAILSSYMESASIPGLLSLASSLIYLFRSLSDIDVP